VKKKRGDDYERWGGKGTIRSDGGGGGGYRARGVNLDELFFHGKGAHIGAKQGKRKLNKNLRRVLHRKGQIKTNPQAYKPSSIKGRESFEQKKK